MPAKNFLALGKDILSDALRPQLTQAADLAGNLPTSLDGLITARNALAPIEEYRQSLEQAFGTIDQENLLPPLWQRIAALESHQDVAVEFRAALEVRTRESRRSAASWTSTQS